MKQFSFVSFIGAIFGITLVRTFIENFSNPEPLGGFTGALLINNYFLFYLALVASLGLLFAVYFKESITKHLYRITAFLPIIWIAPIIDLFVSGGACMAYIGKTNTSLLIDALTFFGNLPQYCGITLGIRIEVIIIMIATSWYVYKKTYSLLTSISLSLITYLIIFVHLAVPGIIGTLAGLRGPEEITAWIQQSLIGTIHTPSAGGVAELINQIAIFASRPAWILLILATLIGALLSARAETLSWLRNTRLTRTIYYLCITLAGGAAALIFTQSYLPHHSLDIVAYIILVILVVINWWLAVAINDFVDQHLDTINSPGRPLTSGTLTESHYKNLIVVFFGLLITGGLLINWNAFILLLVFQCAYLLYSLHPTYLKKHFIGSSLMVGLAGTATFLAGYFTLAPNQSFSGVSYGMVGAVFITLAIISNTKDFKDVAGDAKYSIKTLPVVFGRRKAGMLLSTTWVVWLTILGLIIHPGFIAYATIWAALDLVFRKKIPEYLRFIIIIIQIIITPLLFL